MILIGIMQKDLRVDKVMLIARQKHSNDGKQCKYCLDFVTLNDHPFPFNRRPNSEHCCELWNNGETRRHFVIRNTLLIRITNKKYMNYCS
jgi:hypothetical protein